MTTEQAAGRAIPAPKTAVEREETPPHLQYLQEITALTRRWYIELTRERLNLLFSVLQPAIWLIFFGAGVGRTVDEDVIGTSDYIAFMLPGIIAFTVVGNGVAGAMPLMWDKEQGYLDKMMSMPIARSSIIVSRFVFMAALGSVQSLLVIVVALVMGVDIAAGVLGVVGMLAAAALLGLAVTAIYCGLAYWVPGHGTFFAITGFITLPLLFMSNAFVPLDAMPDWMAAVALANPLTYAITAMRTLVLDGWETDLLLSFGVLLAVSLVCLAIGTYQFGRTTAERVTETGQ
jgi:ABC-2 type transport system permease protein